MDIKIVCNQWKVVSLSPLYELPLFLATEEKLEWHKKVCENRYFYNIIMLSEDTKILELNIKI